MMPLKTVRQVATVNPRPSISLKDDEAVTFLPMKAVEELTGIIDLGDTRPLRAVKKGFTPFQENDVLFAKITPCMENGKIAVASGLRNKYGYGSTEFFVLRCNDELRPEYLFYYLVQDSFRQKAKRSMSGAVGQLRVPKHFLEEQLIPCPDPKTQEKIVAKIEELFSELDYSVQQIRFVKELLDTYETAALRKIFEIDTQPVSLDKLGDWSGGGTPSKSNRDFWPAAANVLWVTPKDMKTREIVDTKDKISESAINKSAAKLIRGGSVLFVVRSGILRRILPISYTRADVTVNQDMKAFIPNKGVNLKYVYWYCRAFATNILHECAKDGTTVESIDTKMLMAYPIKMPVAQPEQEALISKCEQVVTEIDALRQTTRDIIRSIYKKKQSILSKAFKGELV